MMFANLLAIFLIIVLVGGGVVGIYDACERLFVQWQQAPAAPPSGRGAHGLVPSRGATASVARSPIH
jgi:hypothetical protein